MGNSFTLAQMCANHSILPWMDLKPNCGSQKVKMPQKLPFGENIPSYNFPLFFLYRRGFGKLRLTLLMPCVKRTSPSRR